MSVAGTIVLQVILILINAFFAGTEMAVVSLSQPRLKKAAEDGDKRAKRLLKMVENPSGFLSAIQIAITLAGFLGAAFSADVLSEHLVALFQRWGWNSNYDLMNSMCVIIITIIISFFTLIFGELVPKRIAQQKSLGWAKAASGIINVVSILFKPFVWTLSFCTNLVLKIFRLKTTGGDEEVTEEDIRLLIESSEEQGAIEEDEKEWIQNVFDFNDVPVDDIMTREGEVASIQIDSTDEEVLEIIKDTGYSRFPVYDEDLNDIKGIIIAREFLLNLTNKEKKPFRELLRPAYFVPDSIHLDRLFENMQANKVHFAIVIDEYGQFAGIITLEDLLEEIVGNIYDESDEQEEEEIERIDDTTYKVKGTTTIGDFNDFTEEYDIPESEDYDTIGGLVLSTLSTIPEDGTEVEIEKDGFSFHVTKIEDKKIETVIVKKLTGKKEGKEKD